MSFGFVTYLLFATSTFNKGGAEYGNMMLETSISPFIAWEESTTSTLNCTEPDCDTLTISAKPNKTRKIATLPGTKWCGAGYTAKHYDELGTNIQTDMCCREHDHCEIYLESFKFGLGLFNYGLYTAMDCTCDERFRNCLKEASTTSELYNDQVMANTIGKLFFNVLQPKCLKRDYPSVCMNWRWFGCTGYRKDLTKPKVWQLIDSYLRY